MANEIKKTLKVSGLTIYPVKSLAGIELKESSIDNMGLQYDRRWMLVSSKGMFISQRTVPQMALIKTAINDGQLTLSMQGKGSFEVPAVDANAETMEVEVWGDKVDGLKTGKEVDAWLSDCLGIECHLVYIADDEMRQCDLDYAKEGERTGFADGFPILIISEASLADLNSRLDEPVDMRRFRPNIVITGCEPYAEDKLKDFTVGGLPMRGVKLCSRCPMPMVDPDKGERIGTEPITTLTAYRKWDGKVYFGMNVIHEAKGVIRVGDLVI